jgi:hypothetical protein
VCALSTCLYSASVQHVLLQLGKRVVQHPLLTPPSFPTQEYEHRFKVWLDNLEFIIEYNAQHLSHWVSRVLAALCNSAASASLHLPLLLMCAHRHAWARRECSLGACP